MQEALPVGNGLSVLPHLFECCPSRVLPSRNFSGNAAWTFGQQRVGILQMPAQRLDQRGLESGARFFLLSRGQPTQPAKEVEQAAKVRRRLLDPMEQRRRLPHFGHVGVRHLLDEQHAIRSGLRPRDGAAGKKAAESPEFSNSLRYPKADQRISAAQMVVQKGQGRAHGEAVQPQRHLGQLDGQGVLVHAVDAALEHHTADDGLIGELGLVQIPSPNAWARRRISRRIAATRFTSGET